MKQELFSHYFKEKKVTKMGLGPNGRSYGDTVFLVKQGAHVLVTDHRDDSDVLASKERLLKELTTKEQKNISFILGEHREQDFIDCDFVLKASGVPLDNKYIQAANNAGVPVHTSSAWLFSIISELLPDVQTIGITGTKGKSTVTDMIEHILKENNVAYHVAGNVRGVANLPVLSKITSGDVILAELDSWQLQGFGEAHISPHISVFTNFFEDHLNYYKGSMQAYFKDKAYIYAFQKDLDICFVSKQAYGEIKKFENTIPESIIDVATNILPTDLELQVLGEHNRENAALAFSVVQQLGIETKDILVSLGTYKSMVGRLKYLGKIKEIHYYDDNNSTTPTSTIKSLEAVKDKHPDSEIIWLGGGADKEFDYSELGEVLPQFITKGVMFTGAATNKIIDAVPDVLIDTLFVVNSMQEAWDYAQQNIKPGSVVVLSPAAASFGVFLNEYERGDKFNELVKNISTN